MENDSCRETRLTEENEKIYARLAELEREIRNLCEGYSIVNRRFSAVLELRKDLASNATAAAIRSAAAARKAADACTNAAKAAQVAADHAVIDAAESAACSERKQALTTLQMQNDTRRPQRRHAFQKSPARDEMARGHAGRETRLSSMPFFVCRLCTSSIISGHRVSPRRLLCASCCL